MKAVPSKTTMTILECILIDASAGQIKFTANDMELGIETIVNGKIEAKGIVALEAKLFSEIIRKLPDSMVTIESDEKMNTTITCEKAKFNIMGKEGDDFAVSFVAANVAGGNVKVLRNGINDELRSNFALLVGGDNIFQGFLRQGHRDFLVFQMA